MSVTNETNKVNYAATGLSVYVIPFYFEADGNIKLYIDDVLKTIGADYSVSGAGNPSGGNLTLVSPVSSGVVTILRDIPIKQENTLNEGGPNGAKTAERMFDKLTLIAQQLSERIGRAIKMPVSSDLNPQLTGDVVPNAMIVVNGAGDALEMGPSYQTFSTDMDAKVSQAQTYANNAQASATNAATSESNADTSKNAAATSASNAATSESNANASKIAAEAAKVLAQQAADSVLFNDVIFVTAGMSPLTLTSAHNGSMLACDTSLGPISLTLPLIADLDLDIPFTVSVKKTDSSGNSVTINRAGTNLIDEGTQKVLGSAGAGATLIPDADPNPDVWTSAEFGATAGNLSNDVFSGNGSQTAFTLSVAPGAKNNTQVFIEGVYQQKSSYSISGTTITFSEAPVSGTNNIEVNTGTTLAVGTPADSSVTLSKLAQEVLNYLIPVTTVIWNFDPATPNGFVSAMNKSVGLSGADYNGSTYYNLFEKMWSMAGLSTTAGDVFRISSAKGASALADWNAGKKITVDFETNEVVIRGKGASRNLGSYQADAFQGHYHDVGPYNQRASATTTVATPMWSNGSDGSSGAAKTGDASTVKTDGTNGTPRAANETRMKNVAMYAWIKY